MSSDLERLSRIMRSDWDRRVNHDYRFWMSDGFQSDEAMWKSGERDFSILTEELFDLSGKSVLEVGCGVGRMLRAASKSAARVIGIDVSERAVLKARELLADLPNVRLELGNGVDLSSISTASIDFVWSFAALTSMPTKVIAEYLKEFRRVLRPGGELRLQVYLGEEMLVAEQDTLHLRCFRRENLIAAAKLAGLITIEVRELKLPFKVSFAEIGVEAFIVRFECGSESEVSTDEIARTLLPSGEPTESSELSPTEIEAWMTVNYAEQLADQGNSERAKQALDYVNAYCRSTSFDVQDLLQRIVEKTDPEQRPGSEGHRNIFANNVKVIENRFPEIHRHLMGMADVPSEVTVRTTQQGDVLYCGPHCLDHPEKPKSGARTWIERSLQDPKFGQGPAILVYGFGCGYHLEELASRYNGKIYAIESNWEVFRTALRTRDLTAVLERLDGLEIGENDRPSVVAGDAELLMRPQAIAADPEFTQKLKSFFYGRRGVATLRPKIGVVGPLQGGTLPIAEYVYSGLARAGQRARGLDVSGFNTSWHLLDEFVKFPPRQKALHNTFVEMISQVLLESVTEKPVDVLICMAQAPVTPRVLIELRKRGVITVLWFVEDYLRFTYWQETAQFFDFVFTIQKGECLDAIKKAGAGHVHYLPTACDPAVHTPVTLTPEEKQRWGSPVSFVGAGYYNRQQVFASLANYPIKLWGTEWPGCKPFDRLVQESGRRLSPAEYIKIFNATDVNINLHSSTERDGVDPFGDFLNPRVFELAASGAFQLVDERSYLGDCFEVGKEIVTFSSTADLKAKIDHYLAHPEERHRIATASRERVLRDHTYDQRLDQMLSVIYASKYEHLRTRVESGPWTKMIQRSAPCPELKERCEKAYDRGEEPTLDALISDIVTGAGELSDTEMKLLFLFHIRKQIIRMTREGNGEGK